MKAPSLKGSLTSVERKGKYLMVRFSNKLGFVGHLGMTGKFLKRPAGEEVKWSRARFILDSGEVIHFQDMRMFGRIDAVPSTELQGRPAVAKLGIDPLQDGLTVERLQAAFHGTNQEIKVALMNQERIAGLGNIHAAEALFRAKIHPERSAVSLTPPEWKALVKAIQAPCLLTIGGQSLSPCVRASIGISLFPRHGMTSDELINRADGAMYEAKRKKSGYAFAD
jgi:formamidopyrimidine-DNA glycosylase